MRDSIRLLAFVTASGILAFPASGQSGTSFVPLAPCRLIDTRDPDGPFGGPKLQDGAIRVFTIPPACGVPASALVLSVNATVTQPDGAGQVVLYEGGTSTPATVNQWYRAGKTRAVQALVAMAANGTIDVLATGAATHFILDVNGYFILTPAVGTVTLDPVP